ncbi:MAG: hypothetical protein K2X57_29235 [Xanthobacteraceae bacterium]|nr:hypothetical protein [Xanthobacteraceae bacterium]
MVGIKQCFVTARGIRHHRAETGAGPPVMLVEGWPEFRTPWTLIAAASLVITSTKVMRSIGVRSSDPETGLFSPDSAIHGAGGHWDNPVTPI